MVRSRVYAGDEERQTPTCQLVRRAHMLTVTGWARTVVVVRLELEREAPRRKAELLHVARETRRDVVNSGEQVLAPVLVRERALDADRLAVLAPAGLADVGRRSGRRAQELPDAVLEQVELGAVRYDVAARLGRRRRHRASTVGQRFAAVLAGRPARSDAP